MISGPTEGHGVTLKAIADAVAPISALAAVAAAAA